MKTEPVSEPTDPRAVATAYALDELSAEERAAFEQQIESDSELAALAGETKDFCGLLSSSLQQPTVELQQAARSRLLFEADKRNRTAKVVRHKWMRRITAAAACLVAGSGATYWWLDSSGRLAEPRYAGRTKFQVNQSSAPDVFGIPSIDARRSFSESGINLTPPPVNKEPFEVTMATNETLGQLAGGSTRNRTQNYTSSLLTGDGNGPGSRENGLASAGKPAAVAWDEYPADFVDLNRPARPATKSRGFYFRTANHREPSTRTETTIPQRGSSDPLETGDFDNGVGPGTESYKPMPENPFRGVLREPLSTFSIDVDTASYSNVRRFLNMGQCPPPEAVRLEELVNYFPYDYAQPVDGKPFAVHVEMTSAPWNEHHRLARIALKGKDVAQGGRPAANLVFLVDVSGSMQPENRLPLVKQSLKFVVERLTEKDTVSMVTYAGESGVALPATNGADKARILAAIDGLGAGGSTNGAGGITTAYAQAAMHFNKEGINRVILATDGDFNVGVTSEEELLKLITEKAKTGVFLSVLGYGYGNTKDDRMEMLADKGNGNYAYIDSLSEARKSLADQFNGTLVTIAKDVKIQIEFNPAIIRGYRLLGYENRMLAKEDFNNDKKDAGEIGAGHTVTALYELIPVNAPDEAITTVDGLKYQPQPVPAPAEPPPAPAANASGETMTVKLRWKAPDADQSQLMEVPVKDPGAKIADASPETRWAVAVAGFAALLNNSQHAGLSWEAVRALAKGSKGADPNGYRGEFLQLINKAESVRR